MHSLTSVLDGDEWSASRSGRFTHEERYPDFQWLGGWVVPRAGLDAVMKRKKSLPCPCRESNAGRPARSLVTIMTMGNAVVNEIMNLC